MIASNEDLDLSMRILILEKKKTETNNIMKIAFINRKLKKLRRRLYRCTYLKR